MREFEYQIAQYLNTQSFISNTQQTINTLINSDIIRGETEAIKFETLSSVGLSALYHPTGPPDFDLLARYKADSRIYNIYGTFGYISDIFKVRLSGKYYEEETTDEEGNPTTITKFRLLNSNLTLDLITPTKYLEYNDTFRDTDIDYLFKEDGSHITYHRRHLNALCIQDDRLYSLYRLSVSRFGEVLSDTYWKVRVNSDYSGEIYLYDRYDKWILEELITYCNKYAEIGGYDTVTIDDFKLPEFTESEFYALGTSTSKIKIATILPIEFYSRIGIITGVPSISGVFNDFEQSFIIEHHYIDLSTPVQPDLAFLIKYFSETPLKANIYKDGQGHIYNIFKNQETYSLISPKDTTDLQFYNPYFNNYPDDINQTIIMVLPKFNRPDKQANFMPLIFNPRLKNKDGEILSPDDIPTPDAYLEFQDSAGNQIYQIPFFFKNKALWAEIIKYKGDDSLDNWQYWDTTVSKTTFYILGKYSHPIDIGSALFPGASYFAIQTIRFYEIRAEISVKNSDHASISTTVWVKFITEDFDIDNITTEEMQNLNGIGNWRMGGVAAQSEYPYTNSDISTVRALKYNCKFATERVDAGSDIVYGALFIITINYGTDGTITNYHITLNPVKQHIENQYGTIVVVITH